MRPRIPIVIDIESAADADWLAATEEAFILQMKPHGSCKSKESIDNWFAKNLEAKLQERVERAPLSPMDGKIRAIAVAPLWDDVAPNAKVGDEADLIRWVVDDAIDCISIFRGRSVPILAGWHINEFDIPFISARAAVHGIELPDWWPANPRRYGATLDGAEILREGRLAQWLARFGLPPKLGDGKDAPYLPDDQLVEYVIRDVECERALLRRLALVSHEIAMTNPANQTQEAEARAIHD